jgi:hypothetical protein
MRAFLYILSASKDPNRVRCAVPWRIDGKSIFFGPCKKRLRHWLKQNILDSGQEVEPIEPIFVIGFNGANRSKERKIVWAGQITRVMTFARAYHLLTGPKYRRMRDHEYSPLHLEPIEVDGQFGYRHISFEHGKDNAWVWDVVDRKHARNVEQREDIILLKEKADRQEAFALDCCFLCKCIFYARGRGIPVAGEILGVLREAQPDEYIDQYAIFGHLNDGTANGLRGRYCEITDDTQVRQLLRATRRQASLLQRDSRVVHDAMVITCLRGCRD